MQRKSSLKKKKVLLSLFHDQLFSKKPTYFSLGELERCFILSKCIEWEEERAQGKVEA